jgi:Leucine-rich repeat (LRR) protein
LAAGALPQLYLLYLSANRIEDRGCAAIMAPLFGSCCCPTLTFLNLRENGIESVTPLFGAYVDNGVAGVQAGAGPGAATTATVQAIVTLPSLTTTLDLSWNCIGIANLEALAEALAVRSSLTNSSSLRPSLTELDLKGNLLSDACCARLCAALRASGATPLLILDTESESDAGGVQA